MKKMVNSHWPIHQRWSDSIFIIFMPVLALIITAIICDPRGADYIYNASTPVWFILGANILTHAHVLVGFSRSYLNKSIFRTYLLRFTLVPLITIVLMIIWSPLFLFFGVVAIYWDEWHSIMQTFGFGRIYDHRFGNNPIEGRKLDMGMAFMVGLYPSLLLLTVVPKSQIDETLVNYLELPLKFVKQFGHYLENVQTILIVGGTIFAIIYIIYYFKLVNGGYKISTPKILLFLSTGISSVYVACNYTIADGVFFGNIYHALQYFYVVYISERMELGEKMPTANSTYETKKRNGSLLYFLIIVPIVFVLATARQYTETFKILGVIWLSTSIFHFWFDGFIWSVRKKEI